MEIDRTYSVVIVDDEKTILNALEILISPYIDYNKYELLLCENASEAIEIIKENAEQSILPALIICDYLMPGIKGDSLLSTLHEQYPTALKIMLTGQVNLEAVTHAINNANLYRYIAKPWESNDLILTIKEALQLFEHKIAIEEQNQTLLNQNKELSDQRKALHLAMKTSTTYWWQWDHQNKKMKIDPLLRFRMGIQHDGEFDQSFFFDKVHNDDLENINISLHDMETKKAPSYHAEFRIRDTKGNYIWFDSTGDAISVDDEGNPLILTGTFHDNHVRKSYELLIEKNERKYKILYDNTPLGILNGKFVIDNDDNVVDVRINEVNQRAIEIFNLDTEKLFEYTVFEYLEFFAEAFQKFFNLVYHSKEIQQIEDYMQVFKKHLKVTSFLFEPTNHEVVFFVDDKTQQYVLEENNRRAKETAEENNNMKSAFLANMSHEVRTPINQVVGYSHLLRKESVSVEEKLDYINIINQNAESLLELMNSIIDISKIVANELTLVKTNVSVNSTLHEIYNKYLNIASYAYPDKKLNIFVTKPLTDNEALLHTDESRLAQMLSIFVDNAIKFTHEGFVEIGYEIKNNDKIIFFIKDSGIGIKKDNKDKIFDAFRQLDSSYTRQYEGTGIGLALARSLSGVLGAKIQLESEYQKGTSIFVEFPYKPIISHTVQIEALNRKSSPEVLKELLADKKILVVDDNKEILQYFTTILKILKLDVITAHSANHAFEQYSMNSDIEIILMDIQMPEITGTEAMLDFKDAEPSLYIIAQTAFAASGDEDKFLDLGFDDYIAKPIKQQELIRKLIMAAQKIQNRKTA